MAVADLPKIPEDMVPRLDPEWVELWNNHGRFVKRLDGVDIATFRKDPAAYSFTYASDIGPDVHNVQDINVHVSDPTGEVTARMYSPDSKTPVPLHFNMHGGGWVLGGLKSEQAWCRHVVNNVGIKVVDIDYRLAPEFRFPVAIYDCWTVIKFFIEHAEKYGVDPKRISIGGLSAGGHMTAVLAQFARAEKIDLKLQLMIVPSVDFRWDIASEPVRSQSLRKYPSATEFADVPWAPRQRLTWFMDHWLGSDQAYRDSITNNWILSPILAESLEGLAPAHLVTAEFDLARDETEMYGEMLKAAGVQTTMKRYLGVPHAFGHYNHPSKGLSKSHQYINDTSDVLRLAHSL